MSYMRGGYALVTSVVLASLAACGGGENGDGGAIPQACNPLGGTSCMMPWPSSAFLTPSDDTVTGYRLDIPADATPVNVDGRAVDPTPWNRWDGFGPTGAILAAFPTGVSADGLPSHDELERSVGPDSPIILLNMDTGERAVFFAEVDMNTDFPEKRALIIRPLERLKPASRYVVAIRDTVRAPDGGPLPIPEGFQAILDGRTLKHPLFERVAGGYDAIFGALEAEGVSRDELVLAWDFVTASDEYLTSDLRAMRDQAVPFIGQAGANLSFQAEEIDSGRPELVHKLYVGTYDSPNFLTDGERDDSILIRGADELPELDGVYDANFSAIVPRCVETAELPIPVMIFGHGLFGNAEDYLDDGFLQEVANDYCFVIVGGDFIGLTNRQITTAAFAANDLNRSHGLVEKLAQGVINFIALENLARGPLADSPLFQVDGQAIIDPNQVFYLGASLGGIMGGTFMAYDPNIERGALGVPGAAWSLLIERSFAWSPLQVAMIAAYENQLDYQQLIALLAMSMERYDPVTTAPRVLHGNDPLLQVPAKQLLLYEAIGDSLVTNLATELFARTLEIGVCGPTMREPYGLPVDTSPMTSALTIYDERPNPMPGSNNVPPPEDNGTHADINERAAVLGQVEQFFFEGVIVNHCRDGATAVPCDCTKGVCD